MICNVICHEEHCLFSPFSPAAVLISSWGLGGQEEDRQRKYENSHAQNICNTVWNIFSAVCKTGVFSYLLLAVFSQIALSGLNTK